MTNNDQYPPVPEELILEDLDSFRALSHPVRIRILSQLRTAKSVAEVATALDVPATRLYYHFKALTDTAIIEVIETRKKGTQLEKIYRIRGRYVRPGPGIWDSASDPYEFAEVAASVIIDPARAEVVDSLARNAAKDLNLERISGTLGRSIASIPRERVNEFAERVNEIVNDMSEAESDDGTPVSFTYVLVPLDQDDAPTPQGDTP
jgi:DNA-binding transcriptional ArsR family regulator